MLETRSSYGWGSGMGVLSREQQEKWEICYRCCCGFGIVGWKLFDTEAEAINEGNRLKEAEGWQEVWVRHPSKYYSNY